MPSHRKIIGVVPIPTARPDNPPAVPQASRRRLPTSRIMGHYSAHWEAYRKESRKGVCRLGLLVGLGLPATALVAYGVGQLTGEYPIRLHLGLLVVWLVATTLVAIRYSRVRCPRCGTTYTRGKWLCDCPQCGLRMLQDDP